MLQPRRAFLSLLILLAACGTKARRFTGKWQEIGKTEVLEFFPDGRVSIADQGITTRGKWSGLKGGRVKVEARWPGIIITFTGGLRGDTLRLIAPDGDTSSYLRVEPPR